MAENFESFKFEVKAQKKQQKLAALQKDANGNRPPEVRLGRITVSGLVPLEFTNEMSFPPLSELIQLNEESGGKLIELSIQEGDSDEEEAGKSDNLIAWKVISVDPKLIEIQLEFRRPLQVSQGDQYDQLFVSLQLSQFKDVHGAQLPPIVSKMKDIPPQMTSASEASNLQASGTAVQTVMASASIVQLIFGFLLTASLSQLWSLLNSQQIVLKLPMCEHLKIPANTMLIID